MTRRPFVCIVDDDKSVLSALGRLLRAEDFEVQEFESGEPLLAMLGSRRPDYVVLDIHMPAMSGLEVRNGIRAVDETIPIGFITAHDGEAIDRLAAEAGSVRVFRKPFGADRLIEAIVEAVTDRSMLFVNQSTQKEAQ